MEAMLKAGIITDEDRVLDQISNGLGGENVTCTKYSEGDEGHSPVCDLLILDADCYSGLRALSLGTFSGSRVPMIIMGKPDTICSLNGHLSGNEFIVKPYDVLELKLRARRLLDKDTGYSGEELTVIGDLTIDTARYEVRIAGHLVDLTFREYELLKFLACKPGHVFTRSTLLDRVWDQEYLGGDRTVDVHIRRLRGKIEAFGHSFIETVRNVGYRFRCIT